MPELSELAEDQRLSPQSNAAYGESAFGFIAPGKRRVGAESLDARTIMIFVFSAFIQ